MRRYLERAPAALAVWRAIEARHFGSVAMPRPLLDVGAGFGEFGRAFFEEAPDVGLDISRRDLTICRHEGVYRSLVEGDARAMPFTSESFQTVMSVSVLEHIPGTERVFPEMRRVLRPGGTLVFSVPLVDMDRYMLFPPLARRVGLGAVADAYVKRVHAAFKHVNLHEPEFWLGLARDNDFEIIEQRRIISRRATRAFDAGLPTALLSQVGRKTNGRRAVWHPRLVVDLWVRALSRLVEAPEREGDGSNLFVVGRRR